MQDDCHFIGDWKIHWKLECSRGLGRFGGGPDCFAQHDEILD